MPTFGSAKGLDPNPAALEPKKKMLEMPEVQEKQQPRAKLSPGASNKSRDWSYL